MPEDEFEYEVVDEAAMLSPDLDRRVQSAMQVAEGQIASGDIRVNFRWGKEQLGLIKSVADAMGIPYQTYIKQVLYRQALADKAMIEGRTAPPQ